MKKLSLLLIVAFSIQAFADCTIFEPRRVICRGLNKRITIYEMFSENYWKSRDYFPESEGQTEAVYVKEFKAFDTKSLCEISIKFLSLLDSINIPEDVKNEPEKECAKKQTELLNKIREGTEYTITGFELAFDEGRLISAMYCMDPSYVRTYKYNKVTQLETDRKDYIHLKHGTYCQDFLMERTNYWQPR
ncbi:MAG: hypothetical protein IKX42_01300 [Fibrobacter sp.]|nr:hypothetical protein [Fibrobacter sp.]